MSPAAVTEPIQPAPDQLALIGRVVRAHALNGESRVYSYCGASDPWNAVIGRNVYLSDSEHGPFRPVRLNAFKPHGSFWLAQFEGVTNRNQAEALGKAYVWALQDDLPTLDDDTFYEYEIEGLQVIDARTGDKLGTVRSILGQAAQPLLVVKRTGAEDFHIPFVGSFIESVETEKRRLTVRLPEGLIEINSKTD